LFSVQPVYIHDKRDQIIWALCRLDDPERLAEDFLSECESAEWANFRSVKRRKEWFSARWALKKILLDHNRIESPLQCQIEKDRFGCPRLRVGYGQSYMTMSCSISHKDGFASVCLSWISEKKLGIDLETITYRPFKLRRVFVNDEDHLEDDNEPVIYYTILWACKEAAAKAMGLGMRLDFKSLEVWGNRDKHFTVRASDRQVAVGTYFSFENFIVAICNRGGDRQR
jgi:phosphopantetheinyl transferase